MNLDNIDFASITANAQRAEAFRQSCEVDARNAEFRLLSRSEANSKLRKSMRTDYRIVSLNLAHAKTAGLGINSCPQASAGCAAVCVGSDSVGVAQVFSAIMAGRIRKTRLLFSDRTKFLRILIGELQLELERAENAGAQLCARLNCFSDLDWFDVVRLFPMVRFWDYTKVHSRVGNAPTNYHLTGSWSELARHKSACLGLLRSGYNVAMAFHNSDGHSGNRSGLQTLPGWVQLDGQRFQVFDGDNGTGPGCDGDPHFDLRFLDGGPSRRGIGRICGLRIKAGSIVARDRAIASGFSSLN